MYGGSCSAETGESKGHEAADVAASTCCVNTIAS